MAITTDINWPAGLPCALRDGHTTRHGQPFMRTEMDSGRARQRRKFSSVPSVQEFAWYFNDSECAAFEAWFRDAIQDGADWFNMDVRVPIGKQPLVCRFDGMYAGPDIIGRGCWKISASLEIFERPLVPNGWGLLPDFLIHADIFDAAMNREWPEA